MLPFCTKTIMKESHNFELACLKEKKKERKIFLAIWQLPGSVLSQCFFAPLGMLFIMKTFED